MADRAPQLKRSVMLPRHGLSGRHPVKLPHLGPVPGRYQQTMDDGLKITQFDDPVRRDEAGEQIVGAEVEQSPHLLGYEQSLYLQQQVITPEAQVSAVLPEEKCGMP